MQTAKRRQDDGADDAAQDGHRHAKDQFSRKSQVYSNGAKLRVQSNDVTGKSTFKKRVDLT